MNGEATLWQCIVEFEGEGSTRTQKTLLVMSEIDSGRDVFDLAAALTCGDQATAISKGFQLMSSGRIGRARGTFMPTTKKDTVTRDN